MKSIVPYFKDLNLAPITQSIIILDIDGTIVPDGGGDPDEVNAAAVKKLAAQGNMVYLCSNSFDQQSERNKELAQRLGVTYYETVRKKPLKESVRPLVEGAAKPAIVIGDKFLTDGLLAINLGIPYLAVRPIHARKESLQLRLTYALDALGKQLFGWLARGPYYRAAAYGQEANREPLTVLTRPPLAIATLLQVFLEPIKLAIKEALFSLTKQPRYLTAGGPQGVIESLTTGLAELGVSYKLNPWQHRVTPTVGVIRGADTLHWALEQKKKGFIKTIIAGPNIVVAPPDEDNLIKDQLIDKVVVPSQWNKEWWLTFDQLFEARASVWAAGVADRGGKRDSKGVCIVYSKNADEKMFHKIMEVLWTHKLPIVVSTYGQFRQEEYFRLLKKSRMMVYLSEFESQGLALHEAWMADIPTLVWNRGYFEYQGKRFTHEAVSAPYLTSECGLFFKDDGDFEQRLIEFLEKYELFEPRAYSLAHFTNSIAARKYLDIVEQALNSKH